MCAQFLPFKAARAVITSHIGRHPLPDFLRDRRECRRFHLIDVSAHAVRQSGHEELPMRIGGREGTEPVELVADILKDPLAL